MCCKKICITYNYIFFTLHDIPKDFVKAWIECKKWGNSHTLLSALIHARGEKIQINVRTLT